MPRPKASWLTLSPTCRWTIGRLPGDFAVGRAAAAAIAGVLDGPAAVRRQSRQVAGSYSRKRDGGFHCGAPQALRVTARDT